MKKLQLASLTLAALLLAGCGASAASTAESTSEAVSTEETAPAATAAPAPAVTKAQAPAAALPDGVYTAKFNTDSSMFHANEAVDGMGTLTVENGTMTFHVSLQSQKIVNLYPGMAADAPAHESDWLQPTVDTVTYSDGTSDEVYGFDIPVAAVDADFQLAILGTGRGCGCGSRRDPRRRQLHLRCDAGGRQRTRHRRKPRRADCGRRHYDRDHRLEQPEL